MLDQYFKKRQFNATPEPRPHRFVVQKHAARRLHYDFRIEVNGVLKSWAVPKGPSLNPEDKRLAMMTEDHPLEYRTFEGTIPKGNYGAGEVIVWDEGTYEVPTLNREQKTKNTDDIIEEKIEKGHLSVVLYGKKLMGEFSLVKGKGMEENAWFLIKKEDEYNSNEDVTELDYSVLSHTLSFLEADQESTLRLKSPPLLDSRLRGNDKKIDLSKIESARPGSMLHDIKPMLAASVDEPFTDDEWLFEIKWDGYRGIAEVENGNIKLYSRNGKDFSVKFSPIVAALQNVQHACVLDGEIAVLDEHGRAGFQNIQNYLTLRQAPRQTRLRQGKNLNLVYIIFDLFYLDGYDLRDVPLIKRKEILKQIIPHTERLQYSDHVERKGEAFFVLAKQQKIEGIIGKKKQSIYKEGVRSKYWLKIKAKYREEAVICGYTKPRGGRKYFGALILGMYKNKKLTYIGHTGTGFDDKTLKSTKELLDIYKVKDSPFQTSPIPNAPVQWIQPKIMCEVSFSEWTRDGVMRHPVFLGIREDKEIGRVSKVSKVSRVSRAAKKLTGSKLKLTNLNKVYFPSENITKGDVIAYYKEIADVMLPYVKDRPQSLNRFPDGIDGKSFYQKDLPAGRQVLIPDWIKTVPLYSDSEDKEIRYFVCEDMESLLYAVNLGCIEINVWNSQIQHLENPDYLVIDLDPEDISFEKVIDTALVVKDVLERAAIPSFVKTSGATGMHIYIPMGAEYSHEIVRKFGEVIAHLVHERSADYTSIMRSPKRRKKRVYIDFLQNRYGQTMAAPYSIRPREGATVSAPLSWEEVTHALHPSQFTVKNMVKRVEEVGDVWKGMLEGGVNIEESLKKLNS